MITETRQNTDTTELAAQQTEGRVARAIEQQTAKLPSDLFLWAAGASVVGSLALKMARRERDAEFVGLWAPTFLLLGVYNKIVKVLGSDRAGRLSPK